MGAMTVEDAVSALAIDPHNPFRNFDAGMAYDAIGQTASAVSFFLRAAEWGWGLPYDRELEKVIYASLIRISNCFAKQGEREHTVENSLRQAIAFLPNRPEAYFFLAQMYERRKDYIMGYTWAAMGSHFTQELLDVDCPRWGLMYERAVCAWWVGRRDEGLQLFEHLLENYEMPESHVVSCVSNLKLLKDSYAS